MVLLAGDGRAKYTTESLLGSSSNWRLKGLLAGRWTYGEAGFAEFLLRQTEIAVMLESLIHLRRCGDGRLLHSDAVLGMVLLCPAGIREDTIKAYGDIAETIHMYLPAAPAGGMLVEALAVD